MWVKSAPKWLPVALAMVLCGTCLPAYGQLPSRTSTVHTAFDARAMQLLDQMADVYAHLQGLDQSTEFYAGSFPISNPKVTPASAQNGPDGKPVSGTPTDPASDASNSGAPQARRSASTPETEEAPAGEKLKRNLRLLAVRPNLMRLELRESEPGSITGLTQWVSDGKTFWTYTDEKRCYTRDTAPSNLRDFPKLNHFDTGSLELLMLIGINPFDRVREEVESVSYLGEATVRGVETEVVGLRAVQASAITDARLYIGKSDHLLHRLVTESVPVTAAKETPGKVGDELDALVDGRAPDPPATNVSTAQFATSEDEAQDLTPTEPHGPMKLVSSYDNIIKPLEKSYPSEFIFSIPEGALRYEPLPVPGKGARPKKQSLIDMFRAAKVKKKGKPRVIKG